MNRSGIAVSYEGVVENVKVYNDGSIYYRDAHLNSFGTQKLLPDEMAQFLKSFTNSSFSRLPSSSPSDPDWNSITLAYTRYQHVSLSGHEREVAPLLQRLDAIKARAISQTYYLLVTNGRKKLTILEWPFRQVRLSDIAVKTQNGIAHPAALHDTVPDDYLAKLPQTKIIGTSAPDPDRYLYVRDGDQLYYVLRNACSTGPKSYCTAFEDLEALPVELPLPSDIQLEPPPGTGRPDFFRAGPASRQRVCRLLADS
jgi:hypothetical protein